MNSSPLLPSEGLRPMIGLSPFYWISNFGRIYRRNPNAADSLARVEEIKVEGKWSIQIYGQHSMTNDVYTIDMLMHMYWPEIFEDIIKSRLKKSA
jgi:hypothetical protein